MSTHEIVFNYKLVYLLRYELKNLEVFFGKKMNIDFQIKTIDLRLSSLKKRNESAKNVSQLTDTCLI